MRILLLFIFLISSNSLFGQADLQILSSNVQVTFTGGVTHNHIGEEMDVAFSVQNIGSSSSPISSIKVYLSATTTSTNAKILGIISLQSLNSGESTGIVHFKHAIPYGITNTSQNIIIVVNPQYTFPENPSNNEAIANTTVNLTPWASQYLPYPIILVHGLASSNDTWSVLVDSLQSTFGWSFGGNMNFCLNADNDEETCLLNSDIDDFTNPTALQTDDIFTVNFAVSPNGVPYSNPTTNNNHSNQSAIIKQGKAMELAIGHVLQTTGKDKVVLLGHSMGGLASREYLQNFDFTQSDGFKHVAKLSTLGTPHFGASLSTIYSLFGSSVPYLNLVAPEAIRDMSVVTQIKLEGGFESLLTSLNYINLQNALSLNDLLNLSSSNLTLDKNMVNTDVNCNGISNDYIVGLNDLPMPQDISISCGIGINAVFTDGIVNHHSAYIDNHVTGILSDSFEVVQPSGSFAVWHSELTKQVRDIIKLIDEPTNLYKGYKIEFDKSYNALISEQSGRWADPTDYDGYKFSVLQNGIVNIEVSNISTNQFIIRVYNNSQSNILTIHSNGKNYLKIPINLSVGNYFLGFEALPTSNSWLTPYAFKLTLNSNNHSCSSTTTFTTPSGTFSDGSGTSNYTDNNNCKWKINPSGATSITLNFTSFNLITGDTVFVYNGLDTMSSILGQYTGATIPASITANTGKMLVRFKTNSTSNSTGWDANYTSLTVPTYCNGNTNLTYASGSLSDGGGTNNYSNYSSCTWLINPPNANSIQLSFNNFSTELNKDIVNIYDGIDNNSPLLGSYSGATMPPTINSTGGAMFIEFLTDSINTNTGWDANYTSTIPPNYTGIIAYEYWFDDDYTNKDSVPINPNNNLSLNTNVQTNSISVGNHTFHIRYLDHNFQWSSVYSSSFYKSSPTYFYQKLITKAEYWFDDNYSAVNSMIVVPTNELHIDSLLSVIGLPTGLHNFHIRYQYNSGEWSSVYSSLFYKNNIQSADTNLIVGYRYFFDSISTNITTVNLTNPITNFNLLDSISTAGLSMDYHTINVQFLDTFSQWSSVITDTFYNALQPIPLFVYLNNSPCANGTIHFTNLSLNANSYKWYFGDGDSSVVANPSHLYANAGIYNVTLLAKDSISNRDSLISILITVIKNNPNVNYTNTIPTNVCIGDTVQLSIIQDSNYNYQWYKNNVAIIGANSNILDITQGGTYKVTVIKQGCTATSIPKVITGLTKPSLTIGITDSTICDGFGATIFLNGASTYLCMNTGDTSSMFNVYPTVNTTYTIVATGTNGCTKTKTQGTTIIPLPIVQISTADSVLCIGDSSTLTPIGANTYLWFQPSWGGTGNLSLSPTTTSQYVVRGIDLNGCYKFDTLEITVNALPIVSVIATQDTICLGDTTTLTAFGGIGYNWLGLSSTNPVNVSPFSDSTYIVIATDSNGCSNFTTKQIHVDTLPLVQIFSSADSICLGDSITLNAIGADSYQWQPITNNTSSLVDLPISTTTYSVVGTNTNGCSNYDSKTIDVSPLPTISVAVSDDSICLGTSIVLTANGASQYQWQPNGQLVNTFIDTPINSLVYTVVGTDTNGCVNSDSISIVVNPLPSIVVSNDTSICNGDSLIIFANGGNTYSWSPITNISNANISNPIIYPSTTTYYLVSVTDSNLCSNYDSIKITVNQLANINLGNDTTLCNGDIITLDAGNWFNSYLWYDGTNNSTIQIDTSGIYWVQVLDSNGCFSVDTIIISYTICLTVDNIPNQSSIVKIYPNPTRSNITIEFETEGIREMRIFNSVGQELNKVYLRDRVNKYELNNSFATGIYNIQISDKGSVVAFKLLKE